MKNNASPNDEKILKELGEEEKGQTSEAQEEAGANFQEGIGDDKVETGTVKAEEEELNTKYLRLAADFQNFRRRVEKEKNDIYAYANEKIMVELLNVIDNFDRALSVDTVDTSMKEGMAMILKQLITVLEKSGLEEIIAEGQSFDPNFHHAVQTESSDVHENGHVAKVLQKGYTLNKKVIRPSMVIVAE